MGQVTINKLPRINREVAGQEAKAAQMPQKSVKQGNDPDAAINSTRPAINAQEADGLAKVLIGEVRDDGSGAMRAYGNFDEDRINSLLED